MGTGIVSILLHNLPYNGVWLYWLSVIIFAFNVLLFVLFTVISLARYMVFRGLWTSMLNHPTQSLFLGWSSRTASRCIIPMVVLTVLRNISHGPSYDNQHGLLCVRSCLGSTGSYSGMGTLVD